MKCSFTYKDLEKLPERYPVLRILKGQYNLDQMLNLDESADLKHKYNEKDPAGIRSIKKWLELDRIGHSKAKEITWDNILWLLKEYKADREMIKGLAAYITSIPKDTKQEMESDGEFNHCGEN